MRTLLLALTVTIALSAQAAVNFSGKWTIQGGGRGGGGRGGGPTLTLNQVGTDVAGELNGGGGGGGGSTAPINNEIYDGKVENGALFFYVWRGTDKPVKTFYKGTLSAAGDEIAFTVTGGVARGGAPPATQTVTARRAK